MPSPTQTNDADRPASLGGQIFGHAILLLFCVFLPALVTATAPVTLTNFVRSDNAVRATVSKHLLFLIPYSIRHIDQIESVDGQLVAGTRNPSRSTAGESSRTTQTESSAYLIIKGAIAEARIEVSPASIGRVRAKVDNFVSNTTQTRLRLVTVSNWKFGVIVGGALSLLTLFYIYLRSVPLSVESNTTEFRYATIATRRREP